MVTRYTHITGKHYLLLKVRFWLSLLLTHSRNCSVKGRAEIIRELRRNTVTILVGETGSGKTTREPGTHVLVHPSLIYAKRYPNIFWRRVYQTGNALRSPNRGGLLLHLLRPVFPRSKGFLWARLLDILFGLTSVAAQARRSNSSRMECWFGN